ncbi:MAG: hypothetical protein ACYSR0_11130 [Planctomycetota bacterium]|jgi:hypothetical protein
MKKKNFALWLLIPIVLFAIVGAFAKIMSSFNHNEHMYIVASVFVAQNQELYKDFAYLQTPYLPLLYGNLYRLMGVTSYYFFIGKLISFIFLGISSMTLFLLARRVVKEIALSLSVVALFLLNMTIVMPATEVSNYIMPVAFSMAGFYVFYVSIIENQIRPFGITLAGIFLAIAIGTKLTYATVVFPFIAIILFYPLVSGHSAITARKNIVYALFPFIAGIVIGLLPMLLFMSDIQSFIFNNLGYHNVNTQWKQISGSIRPMSLYSKLVYARKVFFSADNLILLLGVLLGLGFSINSSHTIRQAIKEIPTGAFLAFLLVLIAVPTALAPTPSYHQYFAVPVSFCFLLLIFSCASKSVEISALHRILLIILVLMSVAYNGALLLKSSIKLTQRDGWAGLRVHDVSMNVRNALINNGIGTDGKIATLSPLFVTESNLNIYSELSTGPFLYRVGDLLTPQQRNHFAGTSPRSIDGLFTEDPPAVILVGFEGDLDKPLIEYAIANNYKKVDVAGFSGELYVRP